MNIYKFVITFLDAHHVLKATAVTVNADNYEDACNQAYIFPFTSNEAEEHIFSIALIGFSGEYHGEEDFQAKNLVDPHLFVIDSSVVPGLEWKRKEGPARYFVM